MRANEFDFSNLKPVEIPVKLPGDPQAYLLCECDEGDAVEFKKANLRSMRQEGGSVMLGPEQAELEPMLLGMCLRKATPEGRKGDKIDADEVRKLHPMVARRLYTKARQISGINEDELTEELVGQKIKDLQELLARMKAMKGEGQPGKAQ